MTKKTNQSKCTIIGLGVALCALLVISIYIYCSIPHEYHNPTKLYDYILNTNEPNSINNSNCNYGIDFFGLILSFIASILGLFLAKDSFSENKSNWCVIPFLLFVFIAPFFYGDNIINSFSQFFITWALIFFSMFENTRDKKT